ncbi:hypothetical protein BBF96_12475 [Anoxybacter fermentans]|uniref:Stage 0 sporulation protein A homolog n=2 Tax=Anoxybacter fermentans TaxID=1323375 RepID=A0A3Q9HT14_9FIRM|nr:hypothetical protein BBF96_12475 [Anoxybacter fermentans]
MKIRTVIVEDEKPAREELMFLLEQFPEIEIVGTAEHGQQGLEVILEKRPDLVFIDIEMPVMDGLELANKLYKMRDLIQPSIVFTTAYDEFALQAFEVEALDYLLKPISEERLKTTIERLVNNFNKRQAEAPLQGVKKVPVNYKGRYKMLPIEEILYFSTGEEGVVAKTKKGSYTVNANLTELERNLKDYGFFRSHRSFLVNLNRVAEVIPWFKGKYLLIMDDPTKSEVPVSRTYIKELCEIFKL